jgi:PilX N-terminal
MCTFATDKHPRGAALVIVMLVMAVLLLAGTTFLTISSTEDQIAENQHASVRAFLLAEAGLHRAVAQLSAAATYPGEASVSLGGGTARIVVSVASEQVCLSKDVDVVASVPVRGGEAQARLRATADQAIYPFEWGFFAADGPLILASLDPSAPRSMVDSYDSRPDEHAYTNLNGGGSVNIGARGGGVGVHHVDIVGGVVGDLIPSPPFTQTISSTIGSPTEAPPPLPEPPSVTWSDDLIPDPPSVTWSDDLKTWTLARGTYHYTNLTLGPGARVVATGPVTVYVRSAFQAGDNVTVGAESGKKLSLIMNSGTGAPSEFRTGSDFRLFGSLYGTNTTVLFGDNAVIHGSVIGRRISGASSPMWEGEPCCNQKAPTLHFDRAMTTRPICTYSRFSIRRGTWREILP